MTVAELAVLLEARFVNSADTSREVTTGYIGDFLSFVMGRAPESSAWFTVMSNINVAAVAKLADVACVIICEGVEAEKPLIDKAERQGINVLSTDFTSYYATKLLSQKL